jgi:hypothetical protein
MAEAEEPVAKHGYDHIETYLKEPVVIKKGIVAAGGYLNYWSKILTTRPHLAQMALDYVSAPGMSFFNSHTQL